MPPEQKQPTPSKTSSNAVRRPKPWAQCTAPAANPVDPDRPWECTWDMGTDPHTGQSNKPCNGTFARQNALKAHVREVHCRNTQMQCDLCGCWLKGPGYLNLHRAGQACVREQVKRAERQQAGNDDPVGFKRRLGASNVPGGRIAYPTSRRRKTQLAEKRAFKWAAQAPAGSGQQAQGPTVPTSAPAFSHTGFPATPQFLLDPYGPPHLTAPAAQSSASLSTPTTIDPDACMRCYPKDCMCMPTGFPATPTLFPMLSASTPYSGLRNAPTYSMYSTPHHLPSISAPPLINSNACIRCYPNACTCGSYTGGMTGWRILGPCSNSSNVPNMPGNSGYTAATSNGTGDNRHTTTGNSGIGYSGHTATGSNDIKDTGYPAWLDPDLGDM